MQLEQLDQLPTPALLAFGAILAIVFCVRYWGLMNGQSMPSASPPGTAQVAAVIVDSTALNRLSAAIEDSNKIGEKRNSDNEDFIVELKGFSRTLSSMAIELDRIREELRIQREVRRL